MKQQHSTRVISAFLAFVMMFVMIPFATLTAFAETAETEGSVQTTAETGNLTTTETQLDHAASLANGVNTYFDDYERDNLYVENQNMELEYVIAGDMDQQVGYIKNKNGGTYITDTMDVYVKMDDTKFYSSTSNSFADAKMNIDMFGYYYYQTTVRGQDFLSNFNVGSTSSIALSAFANSSGNQGMSYTKNSDTDYTFTITDNTDPYIITKTNNVFSTYVDYDASVYTYLKITMKVVSTTGLTSGSGQVFYNNGSGFSDDNGEHSVSYTYARDGQYHTYYIPLANGNGYSGTIKQIRLDFAGNVDDTFQITEVSAVSSATEYPDALRLKRYFATHSDRLTQRIQIASNVQATEDVTEVGMETEIAKSTVSAVYVKADGTNYSDITSVQNWSTCEYVGFNITGVGIFGYILLQDGNEDVLTVTDDGTNYIISQTRTPENNTITNSAVWETRTVNDKEYTRYWHLDGVTENGNDFFMQQRIYTDTNTTFDEFVKAAEFERNPLDESNFIISADDSTLDLAAGDGADGFLRYDAWTGAYVLQMDCDGFGGPYYNYPNRHWNLKFAIKAKEGDEYDRDIYVWTYISNGGCLECAAVLDENDMMLPMSIEVCKNFSEAGGERDLYNIDDSTYSYAIFPMTVEANTTTEPLNLVAIQQNWGNYPNSQISSIQFYCPYYHLSTGTTESNCVVPWYQTNGTRGLTTLPDHRAASAPLWPGQPQHNSAGSHRWLYYTTETGKTITTATNIVTSENTKNTVGSSGPIYADVTMEYKSDDGKITLIYNHMEMPHTDENRAYYEMKYIINSDITFDNFASQFQLFSVTDNDPTGVYQRIGYLDSNNQSAYATNQYANDSSDTTITKYTLGTQSPYFTFFDMDNYTISVNFNAAGVEGNGYGNVSFLVRDYSVINSAGTDITPNLALVNVGNRVALSFDETNYTLAAGTVITINAIVMPWGSQEMESDQEYWETDGDDSTVDWDYDDYLNGVDGEQYLDKNVRDVRYNSCLNPFVASSTTDTVLGDDFVYCDVECSDKIYINLPDLAKIKSKDGNTATFTVSGGANNMAVRVYGFNKLTVPKIEEYVNGEWVEYDVSSYNTPDDYYYGYAYDGYAVYDDGDTYSYAFIADMGKVETGDDIPSRTFRVTCTEDFTTWEDRGVDTQLEMPLKVVFSGNALKQAITSGNARNGIANYNVVTENDTDFVRLYADDLTTTVESYFKINTSGVETGQYLVIKYRYPETLSRDSADDSLDGIVTNMQLYSNTDGSSITETDSKYFSVVNDGEWHIGVIDLSAYGSSTFTAVDGKYFVQYLRFDIFNYDATSSDTTVYTDNDYIDIEYIGLDSDIERILGFERTANPTDYITRVNFAENIVVSNTRYDVTVNSIDGNLLVTNEKIASFSRTNVTFTPGVDSENNNMPYTSITTAGADNEELVNVAYGDKEANYLTSRAGKYIGILYKTATAHPVDFWVCSSGGEVSQLYERVHTTVSDTWQYAVIEIANTETFNEATGVSFVRFDYFNSSYVATEAKLDVAFFSFFESEENAYEYYELYKSKYGLACDHVAGGDWILHGVGETVDYKLCTLCGEIAVTREAVHEASGDWIHGTETDTKTCDLCGEIAESRTAEHTYAENPWYHVQGEALEAKECTVCHAIKTRDTKIVGWISMSGDNVRASVTDKTKDASKATMSFSEANGYYLTLNGEWIAVNGGIYDFVYKINDGEWQNFDFTHYDSTRNYSWGEAYINAIGDSLGNDAALSAKGGYVSVTNKPKYVKLGEARGDNISVTIGIIPYENQTAIVEMFTFTNITGPEDYTEGLKFAKNAAGDGYVVTDYVGDIADVVIPNIYQNLPVVAIGDGAFEDCASVTNVSVPDSVVSIGAKAFKGTSLANFTVSANITSIGEGVFSCTTLQNLTVEGTAFTYANGLLIDNATNVLLAGHASTVSVPETVVRIGVCAFYGCTALTSITVPESVESIGENAFAGCTNLAGITYAGHAGTWEDMTEDSGITATPDYTFGTARPGDIDGDYKITAADALLCRNYLASRDPSTGASTVEIAAIADINEDGKINTVDLILMRQQVVTQ